MYRLLIIDDEPFIVDWVYELFQQVQNLELDIYKAYSGSEALTLLKRAKIDIVLTDISMPDVNGLELLEEIQKSWPLCKVIFLTAHEEFEYAHIASKGRVTYLLKTEDDSEIIKAVETAASEIDNVIKQEELVSNAAKQMEKALPFMQREYLRDRLRGDDSPVTQSQLDELELRLSASDDLLLLIGRIDNWHTMKKAGDRSTYLTYMEVIAHSFFHELLEYACIQLENSILVWLLQPKLQAHTITSLSNWDKTIVYVKGTLDAIQQQCNKNMNISTSFAMDSKACTWQTMAQVYSSLFMLMNYNGAGGQGMLLTKEHESNQTTAQYESGLRELTWQLDKLSLLETFLENGQREEFYTLLAQIKEKIVPIIEVYPNLALEVSSAVSLKIYTYLNRTEGLWDKMNLHAELMNLLKTDMGVSGEDVFGSFEKIADKLFQYQKDISERKDNILIFKLHDYIRTHLSEDISLVKLAEVAYLNPTYLSRLYKQVTGFNLTAYIQNARIHHAKSLLREQSAKVYEVACAVGFESVAYFIRAFKKNTGMTPQEYKEKYSALGSHD